MNISETESIDIYLPGFLGKTYYFVVYQGEKCITVIQNIIPKNGRFRIDIAQKYNSYEGMGHLIIYDGCIEVARLAVYIPRKNFSINCLDSQLVKKNILYRNSRENEMLNELSKIHDNIVNRYITMLKAVSVFSKEDKNYSIFKTECQQQQKLYEAFQIQLEKNNDYVSKFLQIDNLSRGQGTRLLENDYDKVNNSVDYIVNHMDWNVLYTSGHWMTVIDLWINLHTNVLKNQQRFTRDYKKISHKLEPKLYNSFRNRTIYHLKNYQLGSEEWYKCLV